MTLTKAGLETKKRILSVCVRLFLEKGFHRTTLAEIQEKAKVSSSTFQNIFRTKDGVLNELIGFMFSGQFNVAEQMIKSELSPTYVYALETAIQLTLTELNENLRDIYVEVYTSPDTVDYIRKKTSEKLYKIFGKNFPDLSEEDFYRLDVGTSSIMRGYMAVKCDEKFTLKKKLECFLSLTLRCYRVPEDDINSIIAYITNIDITAVANSVMQKLFTALEMQFNFILGWENNEKS